MQCSFTPKVHCTHTIAGTSYSELQRDALARSYLLDAVDSSVDAINEGIALLQALKPTALVHKHIKANKVAMGDGRVGSAASA